MLRVPQYVQLWKNSSSTLRTKYLSQHSMFLDNQASMLIKDFLINQKSPSQFVEPHNHRVNACKRAIQTWKNHFINGLCTTDSTFPTQLWDQLRGLFLYFLRLFWCTCQPKIWGLHGVCTQNVTGLGGGVRLWKTLRPSLPDEAQQKKYHERRTGLFYVPLFFIHFKHASLRAPMLMDITW